MLLKISLMTPQCTELTTGESRLWFQIFLNIQEVTCICNLLPGVFTTGESRLLGVFINGELRLHGVFTTRESTYVDWFATQPASAKYSTPGSRV